MSRKETAVYCYQNVSSLQMSEQIAGEHKTGEKPSVILQLHVC